jgi:TRAP-type mannitol/chloroaromatic compound transport system substrate-binding protein
MLIRAFSKVRVGLSLLVMVTVLLLQACSQDVQQQAQEAPKKTYKLKLAETWGPNFPVFGDTTKNLAAMVKKMSDGRLTITIDSANKHKAPLGVFDMVKSGQYDMGHSASYYWKGKVPATMYFTTMPFGMIAPEQYAWFYYGGGMELMDELYAQHGLMSFPGGNTANQMGGWFQKEINSVEDLQGLKMRIPGFAGEVLAKLGAKPTNIPPGELYTALERGTIDALEWVGPSLDLRMGFHKIAPYYYTGWHEPGAELQFLVNRKTFDSLPADLQEILRIAMKASAYDMYAQSMHESGQNWSTMTEEYPDIKVKTFPDNVMSAIQQANQELLKESAESDPFAAKVLASQQVYFEKIREWTRMSDQAYLNSTTP